MADKSEFIPNGLGWQPDLPDPRDLTLNDPAVEGLLQRLGNAYSHTKLPSSVDLREEDLMPPVASHQAALASCASAILDQIEFLERKLKGRSLGGSKLFLYQTTLRLAGLRSDLCCHGVPVSLRDTLKALQRFGTPPEQYWPYRSKYFERRPVDPFLYGFAREYNSLRYFRLDPPGSDPATTLTCLRQLLTLGIPCVCGFSVPGAMTVAARIPRPGRSDEFRGGHAVVVCGFDDRIRKRKPKHTNGPTSWRGQLLIRSSWGKKWGDRGYGWLPYEFLEKHLTTDFWVALKEEWCNETP